MRKSSNEDDNQKNNNIESLRSLLEQSWDDQSMGSIPTSPSTAAVSASESILAALRTSSSSGRDNNNLFFIDINLPSFDITAGSNLYDEILAMEFCVYLAKSLKKGQDKEEEEEEGRRSLILVKDKEDLKKVEGVLRVKEQQGDFDGQGVAVIKDDDEEEDDDDDDEKDDEEGGDSELDDFRKKLMSSWNEEEEEDIIQDTSSSISSKKEEKTDKASSVYRLSSLLGSSTFSSSTSTSEIFNDVIRAADQNAIATSEEDFIIILCPVSREETIAIRRLISRYPPTTSSKSIIIINCKLDPLPVELIRAETAYSVSPLIAQKRKQRSEGNLFANEEDLEKEESPPKIVMMRRYPRDWELFVDVGNKGFELVDTAPALLGRFGPPMEWIAEKVKGHLNFKFGQF